LEALESLRPDALVSDIGLPTEDGYALIRQVRTWETERGGFLPALALTGYVHEEERARVLAAGFQMQLAKPVDLAALMAAIVALTQGSRGR
jgi:CheY-like chemotaxis protein